MTTLLQQYINCKFPIIPLVPHQKWPAARGWDKNNYPATAFRNRNIGTRAGEKVNVYGKEGHLLIIDFDSPDIALLRQLCASIPLPRTTCIRTGGGHRGYHLFYLTENETRKRGMLAYREASIDLLGKGSFAVIPPSVVDRPYKYLISLKEIAFLPSEKYESLLSILQHWKQVCLSIKHVTGNKISPDRALENLGKQNASPEMITFFQESIAQSAATSSGTP